MNKSLLSIALSLLVMLIPVQILAEAVVQGDTQLVSNQPIASEKDQLIKPRVAIIYVNDPIDFKKVTLDLIAAAKNEEIAGIILEINSYGGPVDTFSALHDVIKKVTTIKPVVGLVTGSALSCGYLVASATDYIIAPSCSEIGNIGVIHVIQRYRKPRVIGEIEAKLDVEIFQVGTFKTINNNYAKDLSEHDRNYIQFELDKVYRQILNIITENRNLNPEQHTIWADGKSFIAPDALRLKLIDEIGTMFEAEEKVCELISKQNPDHIYAHGIEAVFYEPQKETATQTV